MPGVVRYKPPEALRWIEIGTASLRKSPDIGDEEPSGPREVIASVLRRVIDLGKGALADATHRSIAKVEYRLFDDRFEIESPGNVRSFPYKSIRSIDAGKGGSFVLNTDSGKLTIKPYAWLTVSGVRIPIGWERNGMDVAFELLIEELAARSEAPLTEND